MQTGKKSGIPVGPQERIPGDNKVKLHKKPTNPKRTPQKRRRNR